MTSSTIERPASSVHWPTHEENNRDFARRLRRLAAAVERCGAQVVRVSADSQGDRVLVFPEGFERVAAGADFSRDSNAIGDMAMAHVLGVDFVCMLERGESLFEGVDDHA